MAIDTTFSELQEVLMDEIETNPCSGRCRDCDYWELTQCNSVNVEWGYCKNTQTIKGDPSQPSSLALAISGYKDPIGAILSTSPYFGCVQFQRK
jgi:hypothetical protein